MFIDPIATYANSQPDRLAAVNIDDNASLTWAALDRRINQCAHWLIMRLGVKSRARVATLTRNSVDMLILQIGCVRAGAIFVPFNWRLAVAEIGVLIADADPALLLHDPEFDLGRYNGERYRLADLAELTAEQLIVPPALDARQDWEEASTLLYTSGTSGKPKGVMISESNAYWGATNFMLGNSVSDTSVFLCDMPLFHVAGLFAAVRVPILAGGTVYISKGFDPAKTLNRIANPALGITHYFSVPQMAQMMWNQPNFTPEMLSSLKLYATGGAPNPKAQIERFIDAGIPMSDGFGMTETCSVSGMPMGHPETLKAKAGSIGLPYLSLEAKVVDDNGITVSDFERGELWVRGPSVTKGYWNQPALSAAAFHDGWFKTGDAAMRDANGYFYIVDRKKDMFISGGENVYPAEVEASIAELPEVAECAVIGVPDEKWGEVGCVYVAAVSGKSITAEQVISHCYMRLAKFKVPKSVIVGASIPRTASGKVQKHLLLEAWKTANS